MKQILLFIVFLFCARCSQAQEVRAYGAILNKQNPVSKVQISLFHNDTLERITYSDRNGKFVFHLREKESYLLFFYKPGYNLYSYKINNQLDKEMQNIYIEVSFSVCPLSRDSLFFTSKMVRAMRSGMRFQFDSITANYQPDKRSRLSRTTVYSSIAKRYENGDTLSVEKTTIGADVYERIVNQRLEYRYTKNAKPITEVTYSFETKRRNEGVEKRDSKVKKHSKYNPLKNK